VRGVRRSSWFRPILAGVIALLLLLAALYALGRAGSRVDRDDVFAALVVSFAVGAMLA
jgi:hypothetical protein